eukprot:134064-Chlamydomonas_euryale.AAC.2
MIETWSQLLSFLVTLLLTRLAQHTLHYPCASPCDARVPLDGCVEDGCVEGWMHAAHLVDDAERDVLVRRPGDEAQDARGAVGARWVWLHLVRRRL